MGTDNLLVVIEGMDGTGKSTLAAALAAHFNGLHLAYPNRTNDTGLLLNAMLRGSVSLHGEGLPRNAFALVMQAVQTVNRVEDQEHLASALRSGPVFLDRYWQSGYAYGGADGLSRTFLNTLPTALKKWPRVFSVLLDMPPAEALARQKSRGKLEFYERRGTEYFENVAKAYKELDCWNLVVDATMSAHTVFQRVALHVNTGMSL